MNEYTGIGREDAKLCIGEGWHSLIDEIYDRLPDEAIVNTVKEKFGGLRVYVDRIDNETQQFVDSIEDKSYTICEMCGKPGKSRSGGWILTLCDQCYEARNK